jgi:hypothetical protein
MKSSELASSTTFAAHRWVHPELLKMVSLCTKRKGTAMVTAPTTIRGQTTGPVAADGRELTWSLAGPAACWPDWSPQHACTALCRGARLQRPVGQAPAQHLAVFSHARTHARTYGRGRGAQAACPHFEKQPRLVVRFSCVRCALAARAPGEASGCQRAAERGRQGMRGGWTRDNRKKAHYDCDARASLSGWAGFVHGPLSRRSSLSSASACLSVPNS